jgi:uncharacterized protein YggL (DUF469 family)
MSAPCPAFGFHVMMETAPSPGSGSCDDLLGAWILFLEGRGLYCGGGSGGRGHPAHMEFAVGSEAAQATESDRVAARAWLESRPDLLRWQVGELVDLDQEA